MTFIAIEGVIGVGKTTLAHYLQEELHANLVLEVFEENPFLKAFYQDRERYAFQTQIFFLLSRYHQLREAASVIPPLVSDYMFAKDALFAHLNLQGDEMAMYERVHAALAENVLHPSLVVYLRAGTPILMQRIATRDRSYERNMDETYIDRLRIAYEHFFNHYTASPLLIVDTNSLDIIQQEDHRKDILQRVRSALGEGPQQPALPGLGSAASQRPLPPGSQDESNLRLGDFQRFHHDLDREEGFSGALALHFMLLQEEIGALAKALKSHWLLQPGGQQPNSDQTREALVDMLATILKIANSTGVDLESAYLDKMTLQRGRAREAFDHSHSD